MEARRAELQGMKKSAQRRAAAAVGIDEDEWDGTVESILGAEFRAGGAQAYLTRAAYGVEGRNSKAPIKAAALVIGIQNYEGTRELKNTLSDAKAVAEKFEGMGFDVMSLTDENADRCKVKDFLRVECVPIGVRLLECTRTCRNPRDNGTRICPSLPLWPASYVTATFVDLGGAI
eukprot:COSAG06_NODE_23172_length_700_cov_3.435940_1_plen_175_part_00